MTRGNTQEVKVHYRGKNVHDDFLVYVTDADLLVKWRNDKTIPMAEVIDSYKVFVTHMHGTQGIYDHASNAELESEFGTHKIDEVAEIILQDGSIIQNKSSSKEGDRNPTNGPGISSNSGVHQ
ncbi:Ribosome maturation SBDS N-terminal protein [Rutstroemia sp. NJR-2017a BBW]|nr:Ribosome maturation SBDS N-terminal protein [Rutstroemia sp. NJR-2017a BBW]